MTSQPLPIGISVESRPGGVATATLTCYAARLRPADRSGRTAPNTGRRGWMPSWLTAATISVLAGSTLAGCVEPGVVQVGSQDGPLIVVEPIELQVGPTTQPAAVVESGAVAVSVTTPAIPERPLWIGIIVVGVLALLSYPLQRWIRTRLLPGGRNRGGRNPAERNRARRNR